jgi:hypothetical protein
MSFKAKSWINLGAGTVFLLVFFIYSLRYKVKYNDNRDKLEPENFFFFSFTKTGFHPP